MTNLVSELIEESVHGSAVDVSVLLKKALIISSKISTKQNNEWILRELNGYSDCLDDVPLYRYVSGMLYIKPYEGGERKKCDFTDHDLRVYFTRRALPMPISYLADVCGDGNSFTTLYYSNKDREKLLQCSKLQGNPQLDIPCSEIANIFNVVRNKILDWALDLDNKGIIENSMSYSAEEERPDVQPIANNITNNMTINNIESMSNSQLQQYSDGATQEKNINQSKTDIKDLVKKIIESIPELKLKDEDKKNLKAQVIKIDTQVKALSPQKRIIQEALQTARSIAESVAGNAFTELLKQLGKLISVFFVY